MAGGGLLGVGEGGREGMSAMSDEETCYACGGVIDNDDGIGYCSACAADLGVYAQRAAQEPEGSPGGVDLAVTRLAAQVEDILGKLSRVEKRLTALEGRFADLDSAAAPAAPAAAPASVPASAPAPSAASPAGAPASTPAPPLSTLEARARALGVDYAHLRTLYSEEELGKLLEGRTETE